MTQPASNPLEFDHVLKIILKHIEPSLILPCRLVNRTWNRLAETRMKNAGWKIHLTPDRLEEYFRILKTTERDRGGAAKPPVFPQGRNRMDLSLHLQISQGSLGKKELDTAIELLQHSEAPKIGCLELEYDHYMRREHFMDEEPLAIVGQETRVREFITSVGATLRQLSLNFNQHVDVQWVISSLPLQATVILPNLHTLHVEFNASMGFLITQVIEHIAKRSSNLRRLHLVPDPKNFGRILEFGVSNGALLSLANSHQLCANLLELHLHLADPNLLEGFNTRLEKLHTLRVSRATNGNVMRFVHRNCPILNTLEIVHVEGDLAFGGDRNDEAGVGQLPNLRKLGYFSPHIPWRKNSDLIRAQLLDLLGCLRTIERCPNIVRLDTNFATWFELAERFRVMNGNDGWGAPKDPGEPQPVNLPPPFQRQWPTVTVLSVETPESSVHSDPDGRRMHTICFLIRHLFPNLTNLVIELGTEVETAPWIGDPSELDYVLGIGLGLPRLAHVEILNVHALWRFSSTWRSRSEPEVPVQIPATSLDWETLTIRAVEKSYHRRVATANKRGSLRPDKPPEIDLAALLSLLLQKCPHLVLRIEAHLLLNYCIYEEAGPKYPCRPYDLLIKEMKTRTNPKIELI